LICRGSGLPLQFLVSPANVHDSPFARPLLELATYLYKIRPHVIRLDAAYWGLRLIHWIHETLGAVAVTPWNPKRAAQIAPAYLLPGQKKNSENAVVSSVSLAAFFSFSAFNALL
jgi:transposase